jgi:hypothetical protein
MSAVAQALRKSNPTVRWARKATDLAFMRWPGYPRYRDVSALFSVVY